MAQNVTTAFVTLFESELKQAYQAESVLRGTMRTRTNVQGNTVKFPKIGKGVATVRVPQTDVTPLNVTYAQVTASMTDYIAAEYSDIFQQSHINFDERRELVQVVSKSIARRLDQLCIDAMIGNAGTTIATGVGGATTNMNIEKLRATANAMNANNVPAECRYLLMHASQLDSLLGDQEVTSSDFNTVNALVRGEVSSFMGFNFITMGNRDEGGIPKAAALRNCFAWHKDAMGYAESMAQRTEVSYIPEKTSFLVSSMFSAAAVAIDSEGIIQVNCTES